jgi:hypothetical protein
VLEDFVGAASPDNFLRREATEFFCSPIPEEDFAISVHEMDAVQDLLQHCKRSVILAIIWKNDTKLWIVFFSHFSGLFPVAPACTYDSR